MLLASVAAVASAAASPLVAQQEAATRYVVTLTEVERFAGGLEAAAFACRPVVSCVGKARVEVQGAPYEYFLFATVSDARLSLVFEPRTREQPDLNHGATHPIHVALAPDGTGDRDAALVSSRTFQYRYPGFDPEKSLRVPLADIRVTVRRADAVEQGR